MNRIVVLLISFCFIACGGDKKVLLPQVSGVDSLAVTDHSPVYFFYENIDQDTLIEVNRKNLIGTTNWIFNIDKRLPLKLVVPELNYFLKKKRGDSMHKNEEAEMYFSCSDSIAKQLRFVPFTKVTFSEKIYHSSAYVKKYPEYHIPFHNVSITFGKEGKIKVDGNSVVEEELRAYLNEFVVFASDNKPILIYLNFDESISYGTYLKYKVLIQQLLTPHMRISSTEFIFDANQLSLHCDCLK